jgi:N-methylhydantoinase A/oxoprolinase/acetone carboxylase beta subunit
LDTGGTYTDAVIIDLANNEVLFCTKSHTTREDLSIGLRNVMMKVPKEYIPDIGVVSLSSTLATNSVVEGKGCRVGLICIGIDYDNSVKSDYSVEIAGGHDLHGNEANPLDEEAARKFLESIKGKVDGLSINGFLSVRNPDHENRIKEIAKSILNVPIVCGHELSSGLGFNERTSTSIMNARLIPIIDDLIKSVKKVMTELSIRAPLMIVRGDGSMMGEDIARERPVETIISGPAASLIGAMMLTGRKDAIVMDMGGTTTDIGILRNGRPRLDPEGAVIGGKRTRVLAADIETSGIGGDSRFLVNGPCLVLSSLRVMPVCLAASEWDCVAEYYKNLSSEKSRPTPAALGEDNIVLDSEMFRTLNIPEDKSIITSSDLALLELLREHPYSLVQAGEKLGLHPLSFNIHKMESLGYIQRIGVTPTDILHAEGSYTEFNAEASKTAVKYLADHLGWDSEKLITEAKKKIKYKLCMELMKVVFHEEEATTISDTSRSMLWKAFFHEDSKDYSCSIKLNQPIIGIGAPCGVYIRWVGEALNTEVIIHEHSSVGNAIGAITSSISEVLDILIKPATIGITESKVEVFSKMGNSVHENLDEAMKYAEEMGRKYVLEAIDRSGAEDVSIDVDVERKTFKYGNCKDFGDDNPLIEVHMTIRAAGKPKQFEVNP